MAHLAQSAVAGHYIADISPTVEKHWAKHGNFEGGHSPLVLRTAQTSPNGIGVSEDALDGSPEAVLAFVASEQMNSFYSESEQSYTLNATPPSDTSNVQYGLRGPQGVRRLTPTECERLQAFPDNWTHGSDGKRYAAMGDAVTVNVAQWIGERLRSLE
jgi:site-specific DNA-cytosine methylase